LACTTTYLLYIPYKSFTYTIVSGNSSAENDGHRLSLFPSLATRCQAQCYGFDSLFSPPKEPVKGSSVWCTCSTSHINQQETVTECHGYDGRGWNGILLIGTFWPSSATFGGNRGATYAPVQCSCRINGDCIFSESLSKLLE
jgi:hypothetical protein